MTPPAAFVFDLDGVITDTAEYHYRAWKRLADEEGVPFTREDNEALRGVPRRESLIRLLKGRTLPEPQMEAWMERKNNYYRDFLKDITPADLLPGVGAFLKEARTAGLKLGLASASKNARDVITSLGIADLLDTLADGYTVERQKPAPDLFIWTAGRLNATPMQTVVFEDAEAGVEAALNGGMLVVGIGPQERVGKAHVVIPGFEGVTVKALIAKLSSH
jgi:beta-phosphoglucomutase